MSITNISSLVHTPQQAGNLTVNLLQKLREQQGMGVKTGLTDIDKVMLPMRPGELITVVGYTSWYKSGFMNAIIKYNLPLCAEDEVIVKVTWEQSVEEDTFSWVASDSGLSLNVLARGMIGDEEWDVIMRSYAKRIGSSLWLVGHSQSESANLHKARPRMTMTDIRSACEYICKGATDVDRKIKFIVLDYLQRIRPDPQDGASKREQMMEAVNKAKDLAISMGCPVMLGVQASRNVLDREYKLPRLDDGQETSNIEQSSDKLISIWYPIKTEPEGAMINGHCVNKNLLIVGLLKQKLGMAPHIFYLYVDPEHNIIQSMEKEL